MGLHSSRSGVCFPSYEAVAAKAKVPPRTVCEALKALEWAGVLTWQNRIALVRQRDLFDGHLVEPLRTVIRVNAYVFGPGSGSSRAFRQLSQKIRPEHPIKRFINT